MLAASKKKWEIIIDGAQGLQRFIVSFSLAAHECALPFRDAQSLCHITRELQSESELQAVSGLSSKH
jgi:hypothetical protein